jgi:hypothetical protein
MRPRATLDVARRAGYCGDRTGGPVSAWSFLQLHRWLCHNFRLFLLLSGSRPDALKRAQLDHLCTHTLKGP